MQTIFKLIICLFLLISCNENREIKALFQEVNIENSGIDFNNKLKDTPQLNILTYLYYYNGAGVASADFNNDGLIDLYFIGNQVSNKFYLNKGGFKFEDVTIKANLQGQKGWSSGVTVADVNGDGLLDIYVCQVSDKKWFDGENQLYINQGLNAEGVPTFKDEAEKYGLNFASYSNQATFFDYDLDGDLDLFLMKNQSVHPSATFGRFKRHVTDAPAGDKLMRNDNGHFTEVTKQAGIFSSLTGYGLGLAISDFNKDGWPDIYVGNDFFENDYLYINQKDGTFKEQISEDFTKLGHTTHFSMGNDVADFNNDGFTDILSIDMLPENRMTYTASGTEYEFEHYNRFLKNGYAPQYMQNTLHVNLQNGNFSEIGFKAGITSTEWSWAPLFADFDNDGYKDIFISNGIYGATNNMDFINFISTKENQRLINKGMTEKDMFLIHKIPKVSTPNYMFKNARNFSFKNMKENWITQKTTFSNGAVYADLDNDGDLDLVVNNLNEPSAIYKNTSTKGNYLIIKFKGAKKNTQGIGAKVTCYTKHKLQYAENFTTRGYLSSVAPELHFGFDSIQKIDSIKVIWPNLKVQILKNVKTNQTLILNADDAKSFEQIAKKDTKLLTNVSPKVRYKHSDFPSYGFAREPLIPFMLSNLGPHLAVADVDNNGFEDVFIGGAKQKKSNLFIQDSNGNFKLSPQPDLDKDYHKEDADNIFVDVDNDGDLDLVVVSGGDEFNSGENIEPRLYLNDKGYFTKQKDAFKNIFVNASVVKAADFDKDGFADLFIGSNSKPQHYGQVPKSYLLKNDGHNHFIDVTNSSANALLDIGMVQDASWQDINNDDFKDLILVGHWMPITILLNKKGTSFVKQKNNGLELSNGLWNRIVITDFDKDGDQDFVVGNWGKNSLLKASIKQPVNLYMSDFDNNGKTEPLITYFYKNKETLLPTRDALFKQMPSLSEKFKTYADFAKAKFNTIFSNSQLKKAQKRQLFNLSSCYIENIGKGNFKIHPLPEMAQWSIIKTLLVDDFNDDGYPDVLAAGNLYEVNTQFSRLDASHGVLLLNDKKGGFKTSIDINKSFNISGPARSLNKIKIKNKLYYLVGINNDSLQMLQK
ncbi:MAG: VCBS repeat-containing protein [Flavobacteriaceae bacterium]